MTIKPFRLSLLALGGLSLLAAIWAGLVRMDWNLAVPNLSFPESHGPLMIVGFLGTVIGLERAVALKKPWAYGAPIFAVLSAIAQLSRLPHRWGQTFAVISSVILLAIFCFLWWHQHESYLFIIGLGAVSWIVGNSLRLGDYPYFISASWWAGFLVLTITGERLELSRLTRISRGSRLLLFFAIALFVVGLSRMSISEPGSRLAVVEQVVVHSVSLPGAGHGAGVDDDPVGQPAALVLLRNGHRFGQTPGDGAVLPAPGQIILGLGQVFALARRRGQVDEAAAREVEVRVEDAGSVWRLTIADRGPGIPPAKTADVFKLFVSTKPAGTGLGLPIAERIVRAHGGTLTLSSSPGEPTRAVATFPKAR